jgi:hypothetical protein
MLVSAIGARMTDRVLESVAACTPEMATHAVHAYVTAAAIFTVEYLSDRARRTVSLSKIMLISARCYDSGVYVNESYSTPRLRNGLSVAGYAHVISGATVVCSPGSMCALTYAIFVSSAVYIVNPNLDDGLSALSCTLMCFSNSLKAQLDTRHRGCIVIEAVVAHRSPFAFLQHF